jgi:integrase/recombinase XerD
MSNQFQSFKELTEVASAFLRSLSYSTKEVEKYRAVWRNLGRYMQANGIEDYNSQVGSQYLEDTIPDVDRKKLTRNERNRVRITTVLSDYVHTGNFRKRKKKVTPIPLEGIIGEQITDYITSKTKAQCLSKSTVESCTLYLSRFLKYLNDRGIYSFEEFDQHVVIEFVKSLNEYSKVTRYLIIQKTNQFLKHLYDNKILPKDYSKIAPKHLYVRQPNLPSYYSAEEISKLVASIDRANYYGKRDYAMILLVTRLGLRCSDIANLKYENILWEKELISLVQVKTKEKVELPLLQDIGNAIIDYLKYGRPKSELPYIFLRHVPPYDNMDNNNLNGVVKKYLNIAGIRYDERKHGPHSLRHSLATTLLAKETPLPVISSILGHASTESTMEYLRVDIHSLRRCALDVYLISSSVKEVQS